MYTPTCVYANTYTYAYGRDRYTLDNQTNWWNRVLYLTGYPPSASVGSDRDASFSWWKKSGATSVLSRDSFFAWIISIISPSPSTSSNLVGNSNQKFYYPHPLGSYQEYWIISTVHFLAQNVPTIIGTRKKNFYLS